MLHWSIRDDSMVADEVYIKTGCLVLKDFDFFSLYSFSWWAKQVRVATSSDSCLGLIPWLRTSKRLVPITISHQFYLYRLCLTPPISLEWVLCNTPDIQCTVNTVWQLVLILFGITVKILTVLSQSAICAAPTLRNSMSLHPSNGCRYCNKQCFVSWWVCLGPNHQWIHVCVHWVDEWPWLTGCWVDFECGHHLELGLSGTAAFTLLLVYVSNRWIDKSIYASPIWQLHHKSMYASLCARLGPTGYEPSRIVFLVMMHRDLRRNATLGRHMAWCAVEHYWRFWHWHTHDDFYRQIDWKVEWVELHAMVRGDGASLGAKAAQR